jgi:hypothetical protein
MAIRTNIKFKNYNVYGWAIDDWEQFYAALRQQNPNFNLAGYLQKYKDQSFDNKISLLYEAASIKLNLGGATEKSRLITTDKPTGVFDFGLASSGLYRVPEYFSEKLRDEYPDKFLEFNLGSGIIPPNLIKQEVIEGKGKRFYYTDNNVEFDAEIRQKGRTDIDNHVLGAKLKYATRNRKVYLTFKRNKGHVKYVELYSLFYYTSLSGDIQYAVRHIPLMMVADYLEQQGINTRIYMTRFVTLNRESLSVKRFTNNGVKLPLWKKSSYRNPTKYYNLFIQPIIVKEFGEDLDKSLAFLVSSYHFQEVYQNLAKFAILNEVNETGVDPYGIPDFSQNEYFEGIERYRNKYQEYVKLGIFKSKEVLPMAMVFFHDMVIKERFAYFIESVGYYFDEFRNSSDEAKMLIDINVNPFFNWWMRLSATNLKNKIELINSIQLVKDLAAMKNGFMNLVDELAYIVANTPAPSGSNFIRGTNELKTFYNELGLSILSNERKIINGVLELAGYSMIDSVSHEMIFNEYILNITSEITTYANRDLYATTDEDKVVRDKLQEDILEALQNI